MRKVEGVLNNLSTDPLGRWVRQAPPMRFDDFICLASLEHVRAHTSDVRSKAVIIVHDFVLPYYPSNLSGPIRDIPQKSRKTISHVTREASHNLPPFSAVSQRCCEIFSSKVDSPPSRASEKWGLSHLHLHVESSMPHTGTVCTWMAYRHSLVSRAVPPRH